MAASSAEVLVDVVPVTKTGVEGLVFILREENAQAWIRDHADELLLEGYARVVVRPHVATVMVGDRRRR